MRTIQFNGASKEIPPGMTLEALLRESAVPIKFCAVERNMEIVPKDDYSTCELQDGDSLEVVTLVGGG